MDRLRIEMLQYRQVLVCVRHGIPVRNAICPTITTGSPAGSEPPPHQLGISARVSKQPDHPYPDRRYVEPKSSIDRVRYPEKRRNPSRPKA